MADTTGQGETPFEDGSTNPRFIHTPGAGQNPAAARTQQPLDFATKQELQKVKAELRSLESRSSADLTEMRSLQKNTLEAQSDIIAHLSGIHERIDDVEKEAESSSTSTEYLTKEEAREIAGEQEINRSDILETGAIIGISLLFGSVSMFGLWYGTTQGFVSISTLSIFSIFLIVYHLRRYRSGAA